MQNLYKLVVVPTLLFERELSRRKEVWKIKFFRSFAEYSLRDYKTTE